MFEYPKINTIWKRDERTHAVIVGESSCPEFGAVNQWTVTEKVDGTNIRVSYRPNYAPSVKFAGRTDNAQIPLPLLEYLEGAFTPQLMATLEPVGEVVLFGEGYGAKIQGGGRYRKTPGFVLFDVWIDGWWLEFPNVMDIAKKLGVPHVPLLGELTTEEAVDIVTAQRPTSLLSDDTSLPIEGVVATSVPMMMFRNGGAPIRWKLKLRDFPTGKVVE